MNVTCYYSNSNVLFRSTIVRVCDFLSCLFSRNFEELALYLNFPGVKPHTFPELVEGFFSKQNYGIFFFLRLSIVNS